MYQIVYHSYSTASPDEPKCVKVINCKSELFFNRKVITNNKRVLRP